jgi:predicted nucleic acid-binding Zn ribbon protein
VCEIKGVPTLHAQVTFAHRRVEHWLRLHDAIVARADHHFATDAAVRTSGARPLLRKAESKKAFIFKRTGWAGIDARAAGDAGAFAQSGAGIGNDPRGVAAIPNFPDELAL